MMKRQTDLTLEQIMHQLGNENEAQYPSCCLANELGLVAAETKDQKALKALCDLLDFKDESVQYAAYGHLGTFLANLPEAQAALEKFEANPENHELITKFLTRNSN
jgi:hypothetical protein